ncbi:hypothetical protein BDP27DRAFT_1370857 [Rhodocollybia butyracea]|uniref:JmjC domain-containing protein n=1 Tax=Rhodocollybia butyracea TaxID=206335 RepID=A0A9P5PA55_9AGAR|nr:hypothetical protein BDP27DRAFT_1370857 [Rhodocollybia butyracea]
MNNKSAMKKHGMMIMVKLLSEGIEPLRVALNQEIRGGKLLEELQEFCHNLPESPRTSQNPAKIQFVYVFFYTTGVDALESISAQTFSFRYLSTTPLAPNSLDHTEGIPQQTLPPQCQTAIHQTPPSKSRRINSQNFETIYSTSPGPPDATRFLYETLSDSPNPKIGYLHLNTSSERYWVFDGLNWNEKPLNQAFIHPSSIKGTHYTWNTLKEHWEDYSKNKHAISEDIEGNEDRLRKLNSKKQKVVTQDTPEAGPSTPINKKQKINPESSKIVYSGKSTFFRESTFHADYSPDTMTPAEKIQALWDPHSCRHLNLRDRVDRFLERLKNQPTFAFDMPNSSGLLTQAPAPEMSSVFNTSMIWADLAVDVRKASIGSLGMNAFPLLSELIANFSDRESLVDPEEPYYSIVESWPVAARDGLKDLNIRWESSTIVFDSPDLRPATYTQPGSITSAHRDGFGYGMRIYQARGSKVYLVEQGDCFDVPPLTIHCCLSLTASVHIGVSTWSLEGLEIAKMMNRKMMEWWPKWKKLETETKKKAKVEEEKANQGLPNKAAEIADELVLLVGARNVFMGWKAAMSRGGPDRVHWEGLENTEVTAWLKELDRFLKNVK